MLTYKKRHVKRQLNGIVFAGDPLELARQLEAVAMRPMNLEEVTIRFERWLRDEITSKEDS